MFAPVAQYIAWWPRLLDWLIAIGWSVVALLTIGLIALLGIDQYKDRRAGR